LTIKVYQGENRLVEKNVYLGELSVQVPPAPRGEETVDVRYSYDMNGLLEVDVTVHSTGKTYNHLIEHTPGALSEADKQKALSKLSELKFHPRDGEDNRALLARGERLYESSLGDRRDYIADVMKQFERALERQNPAEIAKVQKQVKDVLAQLESEDWF
jgi:molecular chaperone HscC